MSIINISKANLKKLKYNNLEDWLKDPNHIYIGRDMSFYVKGAKASKWCNPYSAKKYGREECLKLYRDYIIKNEELKKQLPELMGKTLGCWCKPEACHGDILVDIMKNN